MAIVQIVLNALIIGAIYSLIAAGFSLIYSTTKIFHFAHGATLTASVYLFYFLLSVLGINFYFAAIVTILFASLFGMAVNVFVYRPFRKRKATNVILLLSSIAILAIVESAAVAIFGGDIKTIYLSKPDVGWLFLGARITPSQLSVIIVSIISLLLLWLFLKKTVHGKAIRAVADNVELAEIVGLDKEKVFNKAFFLGSLLAGISAVLLAIEFNVKPTIGSEFLIKGFASAIIGGINSVAGAVLGAYALGGAENTGAWLVSSEFKNAVAFVLLFIFLIFRPNGLLGTRRQVS